MSHFSSLYPRNRTKCSRGFPSFPRFFSAFPLFFCAFPFPLFSSPAFKFAAPFLYPLPSSANESLCGGERAKFTLTEKKNDFETKLDANGRSFVIKTTDELTKNHRENNKPEDGGVMCQTTVHYVL